MRLIGFNVNKISAERKSDSFKELKISNNIQIKSIEKIDSEVFSKKEGVFRIDFNYDVDYAPQIGNIAFSGSLLVLAGEEESKKFLKQWESKKLPEDVNLFVFNTILRKTNIKALELEDELNLPLHIRLPLLKEKKKE